MAAGILVDDTERYVQSIRVYQPITDPGREPGFILPHRRGRGHDTGVGAVTNYLFIRLGEWARFYMGGTSHLGYGKNVLARMQEGVAGSVGDPPQTVELMDGYLRQLTDRYSSAHKRVVIAEVVQDTSRLGPRQASRDATPDLSELPQRGVRFSGWAASPRRMLMRDWSEDELRTVAEMYQDDCNSVEIASGLPRKTINQVRHLIIRHRDTLNLGERLRPEDKEGRQAPASVQHRRLFRPVETALDSG